jgi:hypothetical protein
MICNDMKSVLSFIGEKTPSERWEMNRRPFLVREMFLSDTSHGFLGCGGGCQTTKNLQDAGASRR